MKEKNVVVLCEHCNKKFMINDIKLQEESIVINEEIIDVMFFNCPKCNGLFICRISDVVDKNMKIKYLDLCSKAKVLISKKQQVSKQFENKIHKLERDMHAHQVHLKKTLGIENYLKQLQDCQPMAENKEDL